MPDAIILKFSVDDTGSPVIDVINRKINQTGKESKALVPGLEGARKSLTGFLGDNASLIGVLVGVGVAFKNSIDTTMKYAGEVRDLSLATGAGAEESSRFLQVMDDFEVSAGDVTAGMRAMKEKGLVPTIDTLAQLSDQFLAIADPAERLQFAQEQLGRSSAKYLNVLSKGGDAIREMSDGISESLILTDKQIAQAEEARLTMDAWGDAITGVKVSIVTGLLPVLQTHADYIDRVKEADQRLIAEGINPYNLANFKLRQEMIATIAAEQQAALSKQDLAGKIKDDLIPALEDLGATTQAIDYGNLIQGAIEVTAANEDYQKSQEDIQTQIEELTAAKAEMHSWEKTKIEETQASIDELSVTYEENAEAYVKAMETKFAMMAIEKIEMSDGLAGFTETEFAKAQALLKTADVATAAAFEETQAMDVLTSALASGKISTEQYGAITTRVMKDGVVTMDEVQGAMDRQLGAINDSWKDPISKATQMNEKLHALQNMAGEMWTYYVNIETSGSFPNFPGAGGGVVTNNSVANQMQEKYATGGAFVIPSQYGNEGFNMGGMATASGGELVTITPKGKYGEQAAGGIVFNNAVINVYANNPEEFLNALQGEL